MKKVVITHAKRTPVGSFNGMLASFSAPQLGSIAIKALLEESHILMLKPNDSLFFYTDGVTEAFNKNEEEFLEQRLVDSLQNSHTVSPDKLVNKIICEVQTFTNGIEQSDDITCLALKYLKA